MNMQTHTHTDTHRYTDQDYTRASSPLSPHRTHTRRWAQETEAYAHSIYTKVVHSVCHMRQRFLIYRDLEDWSCVSSSVIPPDLQHSTLYTRMSCLSLLWENTMNGLMGGIHAEGEGENWRWCRKEIAKIIEIREVERSHNEDIQVQQDPWIILW